MQMEAIQKVRGILAISIPSARILLMRYKWNVERLMEIYTDKGKEQVYQDAGICEQETKESNEKGTFECPICAEEKELADSTSLGCVHRACNSCWEMYISDKVKNGESKAITCFGHSGGKHCTTQFPEDKIVNFLSDDLFDKYARKMLESYVEDNRYMKWCPSTPHCGHAVLILNTNYPIQNITCKCGLSFCFGCLDEPHCPIDCGMLKKWQEKIHGKSADESAQWMKANVRNCPSCKQGVVRNGGCNHMTCKCGQHFCWLCGQKTGLNHTWEKIDNHTCGRFKEETEKGANLAKQYLRIYSFYESRYQQHRNSLNKEKGTIEKVIRITNENIDFESYLSAAMKGGLILTTCRSILAFSYVYCYFQFWDTHYSESLESITKQRDLFEDFQQQFESDVENLSKVMEVIAAHAGEEGPKERNDREANTIYITLTPKVKPSSTELIKYYRKLPDLTALVDKRCKGLFDSIEAILLEDTKGTTIAPYLTMQHTTVASTLTYNTTSKLSSKLSVPAAAVSVPPPPPALPPLPPPRPKEPAKGNDMKRIELSEDEEEEFSEEEQMVPLASHVREIVGMGFKKGDAEEALRRTNNNLQEAINILIEEDD
uniref:RBR-type E3 ubiquitin transferase n=1 Tax=Arcella intermedia TaxID=1963864 RepID=A0A6B2L001_9EUKA